MRQLLELPGGGAADAPSTDGYEVPTDTADSPTTQHSSGPPRRESAPAQNTLGLQNFLVMAGIISMVSPNI